MAKLKLHLLGAPRLERDAAPLELGRRKAVALLAYLAVSGQPHSREGLAALFWPEYDHSSGRADLSRTLSVLRKALGPAALRADRQRVELNLEPGLWVDVAHFRQLLADCGSHGHSENMVCADCLPLLVEAAELYRADFLSGFTLADSPEFDEWHFFQTEGLRRELAGALERLGQGYSGQGNWEQAIFYVRRWVELEPLHEPAQRQLMSLYVRTGQQAAALRQYQLCQELLARELNVAPQAETTALYRQIRQDRDASQGVPPEIRPDTSISGSSGYPLFLDDGLNATAGERVVFVARERELAQLNSFLKKTLAGRGQFCFVTGEVGQGKTSLINEFARRAQTNHPNLIVAGGACDPNAGIGEPYLPFREILNLLSGDVEHRYVGGIFSREQALRLWRLLPHTVEALLAHGPDLIDTLLSGAALESRAVAFAPQETAWLEPLRELRIRQATSQNADQTHIFAAYKAVLDKLAHRQPLLIILDDFHWADLSSISLLSHVARRIEQSPLLIICAYRPEEITQGRTSAGQGEQHPLAPLLSEFKRQFGEIWLSLDHREKVEKREFANALLDTEPNRLGQKFRQALVQHTEGHPLFTVEMLRDMKTHGDLRQDQAGQWIEGADLVWNTVPARVEGVIEKRIGRLDEMLREVLAVASVEGAEFTAEVIAQVRDIDERVLIRRLSSELEKQHHLIVAQGSRRVGAKRLSRYRFRHNLFQQYLYHSLDDVERAFLHENIGNVLEQLYGQQAAEIAVRLARHFQEAGLTEKAMAYRQEAGEAAARMFAVGEAVRHFTHALELATQNEVSLEGRLHLYHRLARTLEMDSQFAQALATYEAMEKLAGSNSNQAIELAALVGRANIYAISNPEQNLPLAQMLSEQALDLARELDDQIIEIQILLSLLNICRYSNRLSQAITYGEEALNLARQLDLPDQTAATLSELSRCYCLNGNLTRGELFSREAISLWRTFDNLPMVCDSLAVASISGTFIGAYDQALADSEEAFQLSQTINNIWHQSYSRVLAGFVYRERGQPAQAIAVMADSIRLSELVGFPFPQVVTRANLAAVYGDLGAVEQGLDLARQALTFAETQIPVYRAYVLATLAQIHCSNGNLVEAGSIIDQAKKDPNREAIPTFAQFISIAEIELAQAQGNNEQVLRLTDKVLITLRQSGMQALVPRLLFVQSRALLALGQILVAQERLREARHIAEMMTARRQLWPILFALSQLESDSANAEHLHEQAQETVTYIADQTPPALRASFLALPDVLAIGLP